MPHGLPLPVPTSLGTLPGHLLAPVPRAARRVVAVVAAVHRPDHAAAAVAVVVVVAGEDVAERVQAGLVVVPLPVADDLELGAVAVDPQGVGELVGPDVPAALVDDVEVLLAARSGRAGPSSSRRRG